MAMAITPGKIYFAKAAVLGKSTYGRPLLVLRAGDGVALVAPFSTRFELLEPGSLVFRKTDAEFKTTGLKKESYLIAGREFKAPLQVFGTQLF